jgi:hypothetical protein
MLFFRGSTLPFLIQRTRCVGAFSQLPFMQAEDSGSLDVTYLCLREESLLGRRRAWPDLVLLKNGDEGRGPIWSY